MPRTRSLLKVVTDAYPLQRVIMRIGGSSVEVTDLVPAGTDPLTWSPDPAELAQLRSAALVVLAGPPLHPRLGTQASSGEALLDLSTVLGQSDPYTWLDPHLMLKAVGVIEAALARADPVAAGRFRSAGSALQAELGSVDSDFSSILATCPVSKFFTPDDAFSVMARQYQLTDVVVGGGPPTEQEVQQAQNLGVDAVFSESWADNSGVSELAARAGVHLGSLDTLLSPVSGASHGYLYLLENDLGLLAQALGCSTGVNGQ